MALRETPGTPIRTSRPFKKFAEGAVEALVPPAPPKPRRLEIQRREQASSAWCYAACAEMVINYCKKAKEVDQCAIASFVKTTAATTADCCNTANLICILTGCKTHQIGLIFDHWEIDYEESVHPESPMGAVSLSTLKQQFEAQCPVQVVIDWLDQDGSHAVLITGVDDEMLFIIDPQKGDPYGGWRTITSLEHGFDDTGKWSKTWLGLKNKG